MDEVKFQSFLGPTTAIGTRDLRSCSVVLITSRTGAILAHIASRGDAHATQMMIQINQIYQRAKTNYFPSKNETWVVMGLIDQDGQLEMPLKDQKKIIDSKLTVMGLSDPKIATYTRPSEDHIDTFLSHARLYIFAAKFDIQSLKIIVLKNIH